MMDVTAYIFPNNDIIIIHLYIYNNNDTFKVLFRIDKDLKEDQGTNNILKLFEKLNTNVISLLD